MQHNRQRNVTRATGGAIGGAIGGAMGSMALMLALGANLTGCAGGQDAPPPYARPYPMFMVQELTLDVQVDQKARVLRLTNTSPHDFGPSTMWVNRRFARPIPSLAVGQSLELQLHEFADEYGERFRGGGLFAVREPERMVLAQLETTGCVDEAGTLVLTGGDGGETMLIGLVVVNSEEEGLR